MSGQLVGNCPHRSACRAVPPCLSWGLLELPSSSQMDGIVAPVLPGHMICSLGVLSYCQRWLTHGMVCPLPVLEGGQVAKGISHHYIYPPAFFLLFAPPSCWEGDWGQLGMWQGASHGWPATANFECVQSCHWEAQNGASYGAEMMVSLPCFSSSRSHPALGAVWISERGLMVPMQQFQRLCVASWVLSVRDIYNHMPEQGLCCLDYAEGWCRRWF